MTAKANIFQKIFSIKNQDIHKIITVLGFRVKVKSSKLVIKSLEKEINRLEDYITVQDNYDKVLKRLREKIKTEPLNVIFLSNEQQKWSYDSLYREFEKSEYFNPLVVVMPLNRIPMNEREESLKEQYDFYKNIGCKVEFGYKDEEYLDVKMFNPDIVFYPQQYGIPKQNKLQLVSEYALTMYCPYGIMSFDYKRNYTDNFHKFLFKYFVENKLNIQRYESYKNGNSKNCVAVGYPKMDEYLNTKDIDVTKYWKTSDKFKIIYAPHHSFGEKATTNIGTFLQNGKFILELAKKHSDIATWIFKPHPRLPYVLEKNKFMTKQEIDEYWNEWAKIGNICDTGSYIDIFKTSDLMITDCASFLAEYLPSGKPLIRMVNENQIEMNKFGEKIISEYYISHNNYELEKYFDDLVVNKNDYKKESRQKLIPEIIDFKESCAKKIHNYILAIVK